MKKLLIMLCALLCALIANGQDLPATDKDSPAGAAGKVAWQLAPPDSKASNWDNGILANACQPPEEASKKSMTKAFACPRLMLGSSEMLAAAEFDAKQAGWSSPFDYGVVGRDAMPGQGDQTCQCYQLEPNGSKIPSMIVQWANTGAGGCNNPQDGQCDFDLFMGAGGTGNFNACIGGKSNSSTFGDFMYSDYPWLNQPWGGGVQETANCNFTGQSPYTTETTTISCQYSINNHFKGNPAIFWQPVQCPEGLTRVTGCERADNDSHPVAVPNPDTSKWLKGEVTSMQDCCLPSAGWVNKVPNSNAPWTNIYACDVNGIPWTTKNPASKTEAK